LNKYDVNEKIKNKILYICKHWWTQWKSY
jgi:hypothetical protein